ncbi:hypothetical protein NIES4071_101380 (plasmid) [Calothrix sp. NIES-4071]|nr:hypothetical protein NIES4071_101380 [Calothrix sp. NIES-4071]BAZ64519.1 hypothetical protein NIES4105_102520 [Calothrix sp. NIES-4105]
MKLYIPLFFNPHIRSCASVLTFCVFVTSLNPSALAGFSPRTRKQPSEISRGAGSRGCGENGIPLTLLAPQTYIAKTASKRPTLVWYTSTPQPARFRLFEIESQKSRKQIGALQNIQTSAGINKFTIPVDFPELSVGKTYFWQVSIHCQNTDEWLVKRAEFTVENLPSVSKNTLKNLPNRVNYFAENELWYEALDESLKNANPGKLGQIGSNLIQDLAQSELIEENDAERVSIQQRIENLRLIANRER